VIFPESSKYFLESTGAAGVAGVAGVGGSCGFLRSNITFPISNISILSAVIAALVLIHAIYD